MDKVKCPRCLTVNPAGQEKCVHCQTPLPRIRVEAAPAAPGPSAQHTGFRPGQTIAGRYSVINLIGRGGMGCIYKVFDNTLQEEVALKTLLPQFVRDNLVVERFFNEARIARKMAHPNVVRVHDIGTAESTVYISMEFLQGHSLRQILERLPAGKRLPIKQVLHLMNGLCDALEYAHQFTVHRDIKPENVMVAPDGTVKLMDFGISKLMADVRMTGASVVMGTPFYMSPEQLRNSRDVDARADIYSVGVMLYEILTGNMPTGVPKPASEMVREIPPALDEIVAKCVEADPANRYQNAAELREALRPIQELVDAGKDFRTAASKRGTGGLSPEGGRRFAGWALVVAVVAGAAWALWQAEERRQANASVAAFTHTVAGAAAGGALEQTGGLLQELASTMDDLVDRHAELGALVKEGRARWEKALEAADDGDGERAARLGREALQYHGAALLHQQTGGMAFIAPGEVVTPEGLVYVPAFFMGETEVSYGDFARFSREVDGGWRDGFDGIAETYERLPVNSITYYDAQAYAAHFGKRLPTLVQWMLAALGSGATPSRYPWGDEWARDNCNCDSGAPANTRSHPRDRTGDGLYDMLGNVSEWTRTPAGDASAAPGFGAAVYVAGGHFNSGRPTLEQTAKFPYDGYAEHVGFRCVLEIPDSVDGVRALAARLGGG